MNDFKPIKTPFPLKFCEATLLCNVYFHIDLIHIINKCKYKYTVGITTTKYARVSTFFRSLISKKQNMLGNQGQNTHKTIRT